MADNKETLIKAASVICASVFISAALVVYYFHKQNVSEEAAAGKPIESSYTYSASEKAASKATTAKQTTTKKTTTKKTTTTKATTTKTTTTTASHTTKATTAAASFPIDINKVTLGELVQISSIGEDTAEKILALRSAKGRITDMEQLLEIYGIGEEKLNMLMQYLYVSDADYSKASTTTAATTAATTHSTAKKTSKKTTTAKTSKATSATVTEPPKKQRRVNINTADKKEIADALLIDEQAAEMIVWLREQIGGYSNILEVLYLEDYDKRYDKSFYNSIKDYIYIDNETP